MTARMSGFLTARATTTMYQSAPHLSVFEARNYSDKFDIAQELSLDESTVKFHIKMACLKLGIIPTSAIKLAIYLNCELFRIGLRELGYL